MTHESIHGTSRAVINTFRILDTLARSDGLRLTTVASKCGVPKTSAHRILKTLADLEIVTHDESTSEYRIGQALRRYTPSGTEPYWTARGRSHFCAPVFGRNGHPVAGLALYIPAARLSDAAAGRLSQLVHDAAAYLSHRIAGYSPDHALVPAQR